MTYYTKCIFWLSILLAVVSHVTSMDSQTTAKLISKVARKYRCQCVNIIEDLKPENFSANGHQVSKFLSSSFEYIRLLALEDYLMKPTSDCSCSLNALFVFHDLPEVKFRNRRSEKWIIFVNSQTIIKDLFSHLDVALDTTVAIAKPQLHNADILTIEEVYRVRRDFPLRARITATLSGSQIREKTLKEISISAFRHDLEGIDIAVGSSFDQPTNYYVPHMLGSNGKPRAEGYVIDIFKAIAPLLNYTFTLKWYNDSSGSLLKGKWSGLAERLRRGEFEAIINNFNLSPERKDIADFPGTILLSRLQMYMFTRQPISSTETLLKPLGLDVWAALCVWVIVMTISLISCSAIRSNFKIHDSKETAIGLDIFYFVLQSLSQQAYSRIPSVCSLRLIILLSYMTSSILVPTYSASLISSLTQRSYAKPFNTLDELVKSNLEVAVNKHSSDINFFLSSKDPDIKKLMKNGKITIVDFNRTTPSYSGMFAHAWLENKAAVLSDGLATDYRIERIHKQNVYSPYRIEKMSEKLPAIHQSFVFRKGSPYTDLFKLKIIGLHETGILKRFQKKYWPYYDPPPQTFIDVTLPDVLPMFYGLSIGMLISIIILVLELITH